MKHYITLLLLFVIFGRASAQLKIEPGANWVVSGSPSIVLHDMNLVNDGAINSGTGTFKFTGIQNSTVSGSIIPGFYILEMAKINSAKILLNSNINVNHSINFAAGQLDMNGKNIFLASTAYLSNETELNRITGANGGYIQIIQNMSSPNMTNPGGLGAFITSSANLGSVTIRRGHTTQSGTGLTGSINRYYSIVPTNNSNLNATLRLSYFDAELNTQNENNLVMFQSSDAGTNWINLSKTTDNTTSNFVEKTGIASIALQTLANNNIIATAVTGLVFTGSRKKATDVQLKWTTQTETNMSGFQVQRKLDTEADFTDRSFVTTLAPGGNSTSLLTYQLVDANAHTGMSSYRLKIVDKANNITYSPIINVAGKTKSAGGKGNNREMNDDNVAEVKVTVGPNPNNGNFWFVVSGIEKETAATLFTIDGKVMKQFKVFNMQQEKINGLRTGVYMLKVQGMETVKIIVQ
ncbi:T9SS type A sorting domain-containing protein [Lacibacter sediminis]|uniref:T9SS type A sorting domain-containing protein n=1 Tax=Lacibacter sediminis TaxID=2760713 RepID=A0A7G5XIG9_9BACT|nr:T9SS type A sorting domain-containing protein [Lacibacter sediminis]QNA45272.1 T9SS type A sorting domain-containing protein [Lacibacter sediminis]